jgi:hypothetical protein
VLYYISSYIWYYIIKNYIIWYKNNINKNKGCSGATIELAMEYIKANGQTSEVAFPYFAGDGYCFWDSVKEPA